MPLYHKEVGFPSSVNKWLRLSRAYPLSIALQYSKYSLHRVEVEQERRRDLGQVILPVQLSLNKVDVFEVETDENGSIVKLVMRCVWNELYDIIFAVLLRSGIVKTIYFNRRGDSHVTLDHSKYDLP